MNAILALEDGSVFHGRGFGALAQACGEVCFNTSMTGYQEILTDPSYKGQIVTMTYPLIGNYGINETDVESWQPHVAGFVIRELSPVVSNWRAQLSRLGNIWRKKRHPGHSRHRHACAHQKTSRPRRSQRLHFDGGHFGGGGRGPSQKLARPGGDGLCKNCHAQGAVFMG